jgi:hypothetical protein
MYFCPGVKCNNIFKVRTQKRDEENEEKDQKVQVVGLDKKDKPQKETKCDKCKVKSCTKCFQTAHKGTCADNDQRQFKKWLDEKSRDVKLCPNCNVTVEREGMGCIQTTCPICSYEFCWNCGIQSKITPSKRGTAKLTDPEEELSLHAKTFEDICFIFEELVNMNGCS